MARRRSKTQPTSLGASLGKSLREHLRANTAAAPGKESVYVEDLLAELAKPRPKSEAKDCCA